MKLSTASLLSMLLASMMPEQTSAFFHILDRLVDRVVCDVMERAGKEFVGPNGSCSCSGEFKLFHGGPIVDTTCSTPDDVAITVNSKLSGRDADTKACVSTTLDSNTVDACVSIGFSRSGFLRFLNWKSDGCTVEVDGTKCQSCTAQVAFPLPTVEFDCSNLLGNLTDFTFPLPGSNF